MRASIAAGGPGTTTAAQGSEVGRRGGRAAGVCGGGDWCRRPARSGWGAPPVLARSSSDDGSARGGMEARRAGHGRHGGGAERAAGGACGGRLRGHEREARVRDGEG